MAKGQRYSDDKLVEQIDQNMRAAAVEKAATKVVLEKARRAQALIGAACAIALKDGASYQIVTEALANVAHDLADDRISDEILSSLRR